MSESTEGGEFPVIGGMTGPAPQGAVFSLGWLMAELFDPGRRVSVTERQPPFNPDVQLPQVPDLAPDPKLVFLAAELTELVGWYPALADQAAKVTAETDKAKAAVDAETRSAEQAATWAVGGPQPTVPGPAGVGESFSQASFLVAVSELNQAILDMFADAPEPLSAYQLGLALSDLTWLPQIAVPGQESAASRPSALFGLFSRPRMAGLKTLLNGAGAQLPTGTASIVSRSLDNWADWLDVNSASIAMPGADAWSPKADTVLHALRVQGWVWRSVLIADPEVTAAPSMGAWVQAGASIARATQMISSVILRQFWPLVVIALVALAGLLYLVIANLSGVSQVWASLATVVAVVGASGFGLGSGVSQAFSGVGNEIWAAAKLDASAWSVTWLPAMTATTMQRARLDTRGVAAPQLRKNLDISPR